MDIVPDTSSIMLSDAIEGNLKSYLTHFFTPEDKYKQDEKYFCSLSTINNNSMNAVVQDNIQPDEIDALVEEVIAPFREQKLQFTWYMNNENKLDTIDKALKKHMRYMGESFVLAVDIEKMTKNFDTPNALYVKAIDNPAKMDKWMQIGGNILNLRRDEKFYLEKFNKVNFPEVGHFYRKYLAWLTAEVAAASTMILDQGVAGIYDDAVQPYYVRGYGLEKAVVYYPLKEALDLGYKVGFVISKTGRIPEYKQLGFEEVGRYSKYAYVPRPVRKSRR